MNLPGKDVGCHRTGFEKSCLDVVASGRCNRWVTLEFNGPKGETPQTISNCIDNWPITLLIDIATKIANGTTGIQAATEDFRNRMLELNAPRPVDAGAQFLNHLPEQSR